MQKPAFLDLIQQVKTITGSTELVIVGSHCLYAVTDQLPEVVRKSEKLLANLQKHHTRYDLTTLHRLIQQLKTPHP